MRPELGELTLWGALLLPAMYIVRHGVRRAHTWSGRRRPRHENVGALVMFYSVIGALVGSLCQPVWARSGVCTHDRRGLLGCLFDDVAAPIRALERAPIRVHIPALEDRSREPALERVPDRASERLPDRASERLPDPASERLLDRASERLPERASERLPERASERLPEHATERLPERATEPRTTSDRRPPTGNP
jgi:Cornifin (SPRR) family